MFYRFTRIFAKLIVLTLAVMTYGCEQSTPDANTKGAGNKASAGESTLKPISIVIDWQPSGEYYGFFYAKATGRYAAAGYDVSIVYGKGAPAVAAEVATGSALLGTTTSDNLLRWVAKGGSFSSARALIVFNPAVVASLASANIKSLDNLRGMRLGTNPEASVYSQFLHAVRSPSVEAAGIKEDPTIGWSGIPQLRGNTVDAILAYTTNVVVDLELDGVSTNEQFLGDYGIMSYGLVLVATGIDYLNKAGFTDEDVKKLFDITSQAYADASTAGNIRSAVDALRTADPGLRAPKLSKAIEKIGSLNSRIYYPLGAIDEWVEAQGITRSDREKALRLYR